MHHPPIQSFHTGTYQKKVPSDSVRREFQRPLQESVSHLIKVTKIFLDVRFLLDIFTGFSNYRIIVVNFTRKISQFL